MFNINSSKCAILLAACSSVASATTNFLASFYKTPTVQYTCCISDSIFQPSGNLSEKNYFWTNGDCPTETRLLRAGEYNPITGQKYDDLYQTWEKGSFGVCNAETKTLLDPARGPDDEANSHSFAYVGHANNAGEPILYGQVERVCVWPQAISHSTPSYMFLTLVYNNLSIDMTYAKNNINVPAGKALAAYYDINDPTLANRIGDGTFDKDTYIQKWTSGASTIELSPSNNGLWNIVINDGSTSINSSEAKCMLMTDIIEASTKKWFDRQTWFNSLPSY